MVNFSEIKQLLTFWKLFQEIYVPVSKFLGFLVQWKTPLVKMCNYPTIFGKLKEKKLTNQAITIA